MAIVTFYFLDGSTRQFGPGVRVSKFKNQYHIWPEGKHVSGSKPMFSVAYSSLHAMSRTQRKGIEITDNYGRKVQKQYTAQRHY